MSRKWQNTREKQLRAAQRKAELKKRDAMTLSAIKYGLLAFGILFPFFILAYVWQEYLYPIFTPHSQESMGVFLGLGFLTSAAFLKKCRNNIGKKHFIIRFFILSYLCFFVFAGFCFSVIGIGAFFGL